MKTDYFLFITALILTISGRSQVACSELFISHYHENQGNNFIGLYNPTSDSIDLSNYTIKIIPDTATVLDSIVSLNGNKIGPYATFIVTDDYATGAEANIADLVVPNLDFGGYDAIELYKNLTMIDVVGVIGDSNDLWRGEYYIQRDSNITKGNTAYDVNEWYEYQLGDFSENNKHLHHSSCEPVENTDTSAPCSELFFSEYAITFEDGEYDIEEAYVLEIFNPTNNSIDLTNYSIKIFEDGSTTPTIVASLGSNSLGSYSTYIVADNELSSFEADYLDANIYFGGNDAIGLYNPNGDLVDLIGVIGQDPGNDGWVSSNGISTNNRLIRRRFVNKGSVNTSSFDAAVEWLSYFGDFEDHWNASLGNHQSDCGGNNEPFSNCNSLFFSEYIENGGDKLIEIYNPSIYSANLQYYYVVTYNNGSSTPSDTISLSGLLQQDSTFVIAGTFSSNALKSKADIVTDLFFNGDDALVLYASDYYAGSNTPWDIIDVIGRVGEDPGTAWSNNGVSTEDQTIRRKLNVRTGIYDAGLPFDPSEEWISVNGTDSTNIDGHLCICVVEDTVVTTNDCDHVFISEYVEGSGSNKALEIYNPTDDTINLTSVDIEIYSNGAYLPTVVDLSGDLLPYSTYVVAHPSSDAALLAKADTTNNQLFFNGDDYIELEYQGGTVDLIGEDGSSNAQVWSNNGVSTQDQTLRRIYNGPKADGEYADYLPDEFWESAAIDDFSDLGVFNGICSQTQIQPCTELFISHYHRNQGNNFIGLYNPTSSNIDLSNYTIEIYANATPGSPSDVINLGGIINGYATYIVTDDFATGAEANIADTIVANLDFFGTDAIVLSKSNNLLDIVGEVGNTNLPAEIYIQRKSSVAKGSIVYDSSEWRAYDLFDFQSNYLHFSDCEEQDLDGCDELFFSEYVENGLKKGIEIYNPTQDDIALDNYIVSFYVNGTSSASSTATFTNQDTVPAGGTFVISNGDAVMANYDDFGFNDYFVNGNDAIALFKGTDTIDIFGVIGQDPGTEWTGGGIGTSDVTIRRKLSVTKGTSTNPSTFDPSVEWDLFPTGELTGLGEHQSQCGQSFAVGDIADTVYATICNGDFYSLGDGNYFTTGEFKDTISTPRGDSLVTLYLTVLPTNYSIDDTICSTDSLYFGGQYITTSGVYTDSLLNYLNCDSVVELTLTVEFCCDTVFDNTTATICQNDSVLIGSSYYSSAGTFTQYLTTNNGCDSVLTVTITQLTGNTNQTSIFDTVCANVNYLFGGNVLTSSGVYYDTLQNNQGCDSVIELTLAVIQPPGVIANSDFDTIFTGGTVTFNTNGSDASYFFWTFGDGATSTVQTVSHTYPNSGDYEVILEGKDFAEICTVYDTLNIHVRSSIGVEELLNNSGVKVYPNPTVDLLTVSSDNGKIITLQLLDFKGAIIFDRSNLNTYQTNLSLINFENGVYQLKIVGDGINKIERIILSK